MVLNMISININIICFQKRTFLILSLFNAVVFAPILFALGVWKAFDLFLSTEVNFRKYTIISRHNCITYL